MAREMYFCDMCGAGLNSDGKYSVIFGIVDDSNHSRRKAEVYDRRVRIVGPDGSEYDPCDELYDAMIADTDGLVVCGNGIHVEKIHDNAKDTPATSDSVKTNIYNSLEASGMRKRPRIVTLSDNILGFANGLQAGGMIKVHYCPFAMGSDPIWCSCFNSCCCMGW